MPRWILGYPKCNRDFTYKEVPKEVARHLWLGKKPHIPDDGVRLQCPNCDEVSVYKGHQLIYRPPS